MRRQYRPLKRLFGSDTVGDIDEELAFHIEMRVQEELDAGESEDRARDKAMRRFGDVTRPRAECITINHRRGRRMARAEYLHELSQDVSFALRSLRRRPLFSAVAILTLALGIGANSAIFSVVYGVLLEPLPFKNPNGLVRVFTEYPDGGRFTLSPPDFMSVASENGAFSAVVAEDMTLATMTGLGDPREVMDTEVSKKFFDVLGYNLLLGRPFSDSEHTPGSARVTILTESFAEQLFGDIRSSLGRTITLAGNPYTVVGVAPNGTELPERTMLYTPMQYDSVFSASTTVQRRSESLEVIGRLKPGMDASAAERDMKRVGKALATRFPSTNDGLTMASTPLADTLFGSVRQPLFVLLGAVGLVLLIACANVANLLLARATTRESELAVRSALGAGRGRLVRQLLTEAIVLSFTGALVGLALAWWGTRALTAAQPADIPRLQHIGINPIVAGFTAVIAILTGLVFGSVPALQSTGSRLMNAIRDGGRGALSGRRSQRLRAAVVVAELALAVVLLTSAGLLMRSFREMTHVTPGFNADNALTFRISLQGARYAEAPARASFYAQLHDNLASLPGVSSVGGSSMLPMSRGASLIGPFQVEGRDVPPGVLPEIRSVTVTPDYFKTVGARIIRGRPLDSRDRDGAPPTALVNRAAIARWFPDGDPVGERVVLGQTAIEIVGVVDDVLQDAPSRPVQPELYRPYDQRRGGTLNMVVRGGGDVAQLSSRLRAEVHRLDSNLPVERIVPLETVVSRAMSRPRFYTSLMALFAGIAIVLAMVGIFGVMNYLVAQRSREISVRMALGADRMRVIRMVVGNAMGVASAGLALGIVGAVAVGGLIRSQLFGVRVGDPITFAAVTMLLGVAAGVACFLPARRAATMDPGEVLRG